MVGVWFVGFLGWLCIVVFYGGGCSAIPPLWGVWLRVFIFLYQHLIRNIIYYFFIYRGMCIYRTYDKYIVHIIIIFFNVHICTLVLFYVHGDKIVILGGGVVFDIFLTQIGENWCVVFFSCLEASRGFSLCQCCVVLCQIWCFLCHVVSFVLGFVSVCVVCVSFLCHVCQVCNTALWIKYYFLC